MSGPVDFDAYVPRLVASWLASEPERRHRVVDGTLASADISGFTKLAERLAGDGRVGGENLTYALNEVFTLLIDEADALGGDVLKFGGDALLLLFDGPDHERRAVLAAARMQAAIESDRARDAAAGIALRMSVGVWSGPVDLFLVGNQHRELIVAGPGATATARLEDDAPAGEILVDPTCARAVRDLVATSSGSSRDGVVVDRATALAASVAWTPPSRPGSASGDALPLGLRNQVAAIEQIGGEHRRAVVGFVRFEGVDDRILAGEVDSVAADLESLVNRVTDATQRFASTMLYSDIYFDGGKLLLTAGAPTSSGHDEESMLRTLFATLDSTNDSDLRLRAGVNTGPIFSGFLGSRVRRTFTVMGDAVNLAARLMQHGGPGDLLAADEVLTAVGPTFSATPVPPFEVKGKSAPVRASVVLGARRRPIDDAVADDDLALVGFDDISHVLVRLRSDALAGRGSAVVLSGGSGSGKSRLLRELIETAVDGPTPRSIRLRCHPYDELEAYAAGHQLVRQLLDLDPAASAAETGVALRAHVEQLVPRLLPWLPLLAVFAGAAVEPTEEVDALDASFRRDRLHRVVLDFLDAALPDPTVLVIEDSHHLDDEMTEFVVWMASLVLADRPWLVAVTTRTPSIEIDIAGRVITVPPLGVDESKELVRRIAATSGSGVTLSDQVVADVAARAGGNPLFLRELAIDAASGPIDGERRLPESVEGLLTTRIDQLPADLRLQLRRAAVIGMDFSEELLRAVGIERIVPWGPAADFVQLARGGTMRFRQTLFRDVAYEGLPYRHRREVHATLAGHLVAQEPDDFAAISLHFHLAERRADSFTWSRRAARDAASKYANGSAAVLYERAIEAAGASDRGGSPFPDRAEVARTAAELGAVLELSGRPADADAALAHAHDLLAVEPIDTLSLGDVMRRRAVLRQDQGDPEAAMDGFGQVLSMLAAAEGIVDADGIAKLRAATLLESARVRFFQSRHDEAIELAEQAADVAMTTDAKDTFARANLTLHLAHVTTSSADAARYRDVALPIFESLDDLVGQGNMLNNLGIESYYAGRWDEAAEYYERSRAARDRCGDVVGAATSANNLAEILSDQGHLADARDLLEEALASWSDSGFAVGIAVATSNLGRVAARSGRADDAVRLLSDAERRFRVLGSDDMATDALVRRAEAAVLGRDAETADILARSTLALGPAPATTAVARRVLGLAAALRGDDSVFEHLRASVAVASTDGLDFDRVLAERLIAVSSGRAPGGGDTDDVVRRLGIVRSSEIELMSSLRAAAGMGDVDAAAAELAPDDVRVRSIADNSLFAAVDEATIRELARRSRHRVVPAGAVLLREGDPGDEAFLVVRGEFAVHAGSSAVEVGTVGSGEWVGEMALLSDAPRNATVTAIAPSEVVEVGATALLAVIGRHPEVLRSIISQLVARLTSPPR